MFIKFSVSLKKIFLRSMKNMKPWEEKFMKRAGL
jgi:hypothetical protein